MERIRKNLAERKGFVIAEETTSPVITKLRVRSAEPGLAPTARAGASQDVEAESRLGEIDITLRPTLRDENG